jgi:hypothetical protein
LFFFLLPFWVLFISSLHLFSLSLSLSRHQLIHLWKPRVCVFCMCRDLPTLIVRVRFARADI